VDVLILTERHPATSAFQSETEKQALFYFGGTKGAGSARGGSRRDGDWVGAICPPASFTVLKVVPGGVRGGRWSRMRSVWLMRPIVMIDRAATIAAIITGSWKMRAMLGQLVKKGRVPRQKSAIRGQRLAERSVLNSPELGFCLALPRANRRTEDESQGR
jgi:hypothetical protein